jgi:hypothetical protein
LLPIHVFESDFEDEIANVASSLQMFIQVIKSQITILIELVDNWIAFMIKVERNSDEIVIKIGNSQDAVVINMFNAYQSCRSLIWWTWSAKFIEGVTLISNCEIVHNTLHNNNLKNCNLSSKFWPIFGSPI